MVVNPVISSGSMHTYTIGNREEALSFLGGPEAEWFRRNRYQIIIEEYIAMKGEYHCDAIIRNGRVVFSVLQRYFSPLLECTGTWGGSIMVDTTDERYTAISTIDELSSVDGFIYADLAPVGICFTEPLNSSSAAGVVYVRLRYDTELAEVLRQLKRRYHAAYES